MATPSEAKHNKRSRYREEEEKEDLRRHKKEEDEEGEKTKKEEKDDDGESCSFTTFVKLNHVFYAKSTFMTYLETPDVDLRGLSDGQRRYNKFKLHLAFLDTGTSQVWHADIDSADIEKWADSFFTRGNVAFKRDKMTGMVKRAFLYGGCDDLFALRTGCACETGHYQEGIIIWQNFCDEGQRCVAGIPCCTEKKSDEENELIGLIPRLKRWHQKTGEKFINLDTECYWQVGEKDEKLMEKTLGCLKKQLQIGSYVKIKNVHLPFFK